MYIKSDIRLCTDLYYSVSNDPKFIAVCCLNLQAIEERRQRRRHLLNAQKVEGNDGLRRTKSTNEEEVEEEEDSGNKFEETAKAASKGDGFRSLKSRGATGAGQVST